jgi:hypothetical protein
MSRNRVIYQSEALYVSKNAGSTQSGDHAQLERVQSANYNFSITRQDINQYGQLARIDAIVLEQPTVALDFTYYLTDGYNERALNFYVQTGTAGAANFSSGHMVASNTGQNFYITTVSEGSDAVGVTGTGDLKSIIGIGNAYISNYSLELAVGSLPMVSVSIEGSNINADTSFTITGGAISGILSPAVDPAAGTSLGLTGAIKPANTGYSTISALRPGDITIDINSFDNSGIARLSGIDGISVQSATLTLPLSRTPIQRLGTRFAYARPVDFPIKPTLSIKGLVNEVYASNLATIIGDNTKKDITLTLKDATNTKMVYTLKNCTLDSESFSSSIGSNKSVDLSFSTQIGGVNDANNGIFVSGSNQTVVFA